MEETRRPVERAILVGFCRDSRLRKTEEESLEELAELTTSAGAEVADALMQERPSPDPAYLVGRGKLDEIREALLLEQASVVIFNEDLSPAQLRNLEKYLDAKVVDRGELILDIFAQRARSREGKLQVELAQLEYLLPRLTGRGVELSRLGGGIGTRGPGETRLEVDRRTIRTRISRIKKELDKLEQRRGLQRQKRQGIPMPTVSLVGYTNAGKSTLFNQLTEAGTFVSNRMFATLDPLVRKVTLRNGQEILLTDTVGFIRKLPHSLVAAFHATLEETLEADLLLHVIDVSQDNYRALRQAVYDVLHEIGVTDARVIEVYNKTDQLDEAPLVETEADHVFASALRGEGLGELRERIQNVLNESYETVEMLLPLGRGDLLAQLRERARIASEEYGEDGIRIIGEVTAADAGRFGQFIRQRHHVPSSNRR
jgi:GTP-binding protein HflX